MFIIFLYYKMGGVFVELMQGIRRPWSSREAGIVGLTFLMLTLDAVTTIILFRSGVWGIGFEEINIIVDRMHENVVLGVLSYNLQWVILILLFRPMREVEYSLSMLHSLSSGIAAVDNATIFLLGKTPLTTFLGQLGIGKMHILFAALSSYLVYICLSVLREAKPSFVKDFLKIIGGLLFALVIEFAVAFIWFRHFYIFFR